MMDKLLPCPFCGSENIVTTDFGASTWFVQCDDCGATFPHFDTETEAIAAWNRRAGDDTNVATNAQKIRSMNDKELAEFLRNIRDCGDYEELKFIGGVCMDYVSVIEWLKQPAKEEV